ncbi:DUF971 domain-containing protein [bacterium]|nr:DUF971 domain-containing protein [bacterium]
MKEKTPIDITIRREAKNMNIVWADDHRSEYTFTYLRTICPCARCTESVHQPGSFDQIGLASAEEVGRYAIRFTWSDGHDLGIFSFEFLRAQCPCKICKN